MVAGIALLTRSDQVLAGRARQFGLSGRAIVPVSPFRSVEIAARALGVGDVEALSRHGRASPAVEPPVEVIICGVEYASMRDTGQLHPSEPCAVALFGIGQSEVQTGALKFDGRGRPDTLDHNLVGDHQLRSVCKSPPKPGKLPPPLQPVQR